MSYRKISTSTWQDTWFEKLSPLAKLLFIYSWTNEVCNQAGLYKLSKRRIEFEVGFDIKPCMKELEEKVFWDEEREIIWVKSFFRLQAQNPSFRKAALDSLVNIPQDIVDMFMVHNGFKEPTEIAQREYKLDDGNDTTPPDDEEHPEGETKKRGKFKGKKKEGKEKYLEGVYLTETEYQKLTETYGKATVDEAIFILNGYIMSKGDKYVSHYHVLLQWPMERALEVMAKRKGGLNGGNGRSYKGQGTSSIAAKTTEYPVDFAFDGSGEEKVAAGS